jgi:CheY-like chemotaxis protein
MAAGAASAAGSGTILVVEDEALVRQFVRNVLCKHGYAVIEAASPEQALALALAQRQ